MNTNYNFLVLWNPLNDSEENTLKQFLNELLVMKDTDTKIEWKFVFSEEQLKTKLDESETEMNKRYLSHIIVLCELTWSGKKFSDFYGIELVQQQIRVRHNNRKAINLPILFVSFCTREQIIKIDQTKEIINTYGLGNHFIQLPKASETEISDLWKMKPATELEMIDTLHFCAYDRMIASIRHGLESSNFEDLKKKILSILVKINDDYVPGFESKFHDCETKEHFKTLCDQLENQLSSKSLNTSQITGDIEYKVLLIEDEETDNLICLISEAKKFNIIIDHTKTTSEAYIKLKDDFMNKYQVVICDYRIYNNPKDIKRQTMLYPQGYTFIEQSSKIGHLYKYISFSGLPRAFRISVAEKLNVRIETVDKELMTSTERGRESFINKIIDLAEENIDQLSAIASDKYYFKTLYKRTITEKLSIEDEVAKEANMLINMLNHCLNINEARKIDDIISEEGNKLYLPMNCIFEIKKNEITNKEKNNFASFWIEKKSKYAIQSDIKSVKDDDNFYYDELKGLISAVLSEIKRSEKANDYDEEKFDELVQCTINGNKKLTNSNYLYNALNDTAREIFKNAIIKNKNEKDTKIANSIITKLSTQKVAYDYLKNNYKNTTLEYKDLYSDIALKNFTGRLIVRRFAIYCYYWLSENYTIEEIKKVQGFTKAVNRILIKGYLGEKGGKDAGITTNNLFLSTNNINLKDIQKLQHIAFTIEEQNFFRINYPDLFEKWNK